MPTPRPRVPRPSNRRLLTQLETVKAGRGGGGGGATGEGKAAGAKAPDGAVLYELHSRPEQEKFNDAAKVRGPMTERLVHSNARGRSVTPVPLF